MHLRYISENPMTTENKDDWEALRETLKRPWTKDASPDPQPALEALEAIRSRLAEVEAALEPFVDEFSVDEEPNGAGPGTVTLYLNGSRQERVEAAARLVKLLSPKDIP
jgi:hypothetical protein